ncbi:hypothetical protein [Modestobacter italicus]|uniref:hypothetical protein n=1 Tax=Modestobacter italicus (strain DSM 44449 / CECT 9708 / BC 501) TaxID=2732864 RepID=UPI001C98A04B|nr:hypothetical protein [Modestobacter italicus]
MTTTMARPMLILLAGPSRSGTGDDPEPTAAGPEESVGADQDVALARDRGLPVHRSVDEVPGVRP